MVSLRIYKKPVRSIWVVLCSTTHFVLNSFLNFPIQLEQKSIYVFGVFAHAARRSGHHWTRESDSQTSTVLYDTEFADYDRKQLFCYSMRSHSQFLSFRPAQDSIHTIPISTHCSLLIPISVKWHLRVFNSWPSRCSYRRNIISLSVRFLFPSRSRRSVSCHRFVWEK